MISAAAQDGGTVKHQHCHDASTWQSWYMTIMGNPPTPHTQADISWYMAMGNLPTPHTQADTAVAFVLLQIQMVSKFQVATMPAKCRLQNKWPATQMASITYATATGCCSGWMTEGGLFSAHEMNIETLPAAHLTPACHVGVVDMV